MVSARRVIAAALVGGGLISVGYMAGAAQPHMQAALGYLQSARGELQAAARNKAGHRAQALELVNQAIAEVKAGIAAGD